MAGGEGLTATTTQPNLSKQDLSTLDVTSLTPLSPEVISNQATINIGTIGHVAHGKSTVVKALSGVQTVRFKNELERNITIKLGAQERADSVQTPEEGDVAMPSDGPPTETAGARGFAGSEKGMEESESSKKKTCTRNSKRRRSYSRSWKEDEEYEVERILEYEYDGQHWYRIKWRGWSNEYNTWEPLSNLMNSSKLIDEFHNKAEMLERNRASKKKRLEAKTKIICTTLETYVKVHYPKQKLEELLQNLGQYPKCPSFKELEKSANAVMNNNTNELKTKHLVIGKWAIAKAREQQLKELAEWEKEINEDCTDPASITVENDVDLEGRPINFKYINRYISNSSITIPNEPLVGCDCGNVCDSRNRECCAIQAGAMFAYTKNKTLRIAHGFPIYECNSRCSCGDGCSNRVVQLGRKYPLCIFRTSNGRGWGVRSLNKISKGTFICEYVGEVITTDEAEKRGREYDSQGRTYLFDLDYNQTEQFDCLYTVDAAMNGNLSHFINHSCDPNLEVFAVWIDCLDPNLPRLALFACKDIDAGEEITFDYSPHTECGSVGQPSPSRHARKFVLENKNLRTLCKCGSAKCRREFF